eukprot:1144886-Pelagomonas_calceolata.AAC.2
MPIMTLLLLLLPAHTICYAAGMAPHRTSLANRVRQPHQLNANQRHVHVIEIKYSEDTRPGQQLATAQRQHADLCKIISGRAVTLHYTSFSRVLVGFVILSIPLTS